MKFIILFILFSLGINQSFADSWDIKEIYESTDVPPHSKALDSTGKPISSYGSSLETVAKLLVPCNINDGRYSITIIELNSGFYRIKDSNLYIEMKGTNYFKPTSIVFKSADVVLIKDNLTFRIEYKGIY